MFLPGKKNVLNMEFSRNRFRLSIVPYTLQSGLFIRAVASVANWVALAFPLPSCGLQFVKISIRCP